MSDFMRGLVTGRWGGLTYQQKMRNLLGSSLVGEWTLGDVSGTVAVDVSGNNLHGAYANMSLNQVGLGNRPCVLANATTSSMDISGGSLTAFNAKFLPDECSIGVWYKARADSVWTDGVFRYIFRIRVDASNEIYAYKSSTANRLSFLHLGSGTTKSVTLDGISGTEWKLLIMTISRANNRMRAYYKGELAGIPVTGLGVYTGSPTVFHFCKITDGYNQYAFVVNKELTAEEVLSLHNPFPVAEPDNQTFRDAEDSDAFTLIHLPDTQFYSQDYPATFAAQTQWIVDNAVSKDIRVVLHDGDVVDDENVAGQWVNAKAAMDILQTAETPNVVCPGNHDYAGQDVVVRDLTTFNTNFPTTRYTDLAWFSGGFYEAGHTENCYFTLTIGTKEYLFLSLEYWPRTEVITWADGIITANSTKTVIVNQHYYLLNGAVTTNALPLQNMLKTHANVLLVICGHLIQSMGDVQTYQRKVGDNANIIHQYASNYQDYNPVNNGYLKIVTIKPTIRQMLVETYSPLTSNYLRTYFHEFLLSW